MALPIVVKEHEDPPKAAGPTAEEMLAQERAERMKLESRFAAAEADARARFDMMDRRQYAQPVMTAAEAQRDLGLTAEDLAADPEKALKLLKDHIRKETLAEVESKYAPMVTGLAEDAFATKMEALRNRKYANDLMPLMEDYFQANPQERTPRKVEEVYERLVGKNLDELQRRESTRSADMPKNYLPNARVEEPSLRAGGAPLRVEGDSAEPTATLTEMEEQAFQYWKRLGVIDNRKEWVEISKGNVFPKSVSADWQPEAARSLTIRREKVSRGE